MPQSLNARQLSTAGGVHIYMRLHGTKQNTSTPMKECASVNMSLAGEDAKETKSLKT
jgi:hypothetical protein